MAGYEQKLFNLLETVARQGASDLHLSAGRAPTLRLDGDLVPLKDAKILTADDTKEIASVMLNEDQQKTLQERKSVDISYAYKNIARFRVNIYYQFETISIALRFIPAEIRTIEDLSLPEVVHRFAKYQQGLVLVTGPAGHGKSTTLAALVDEVNRSRNEHIITIEDPIEYIFEQERSIIDQREVGRDTPSFSTALRDAFRQDPDIIMVGEMRDAETISTAITAAETGHLILATLHTNNAAQTIDRIIDTFPADQQSQTRAQLALTLVGVVSQRLLPKIDGGRIPATEIMFANSAIRNLIREKKTHEVSLVIETSSDEGMVSLNRSLASRVKSGDISMEIAENYSLNPNELKMLVGK
ncbi:MAG: type IV pilus twitching motility protein PilT [Candidatus Spechtbacterales bacterium]|nr:type IV pilus twitching motility protein PilT [Candidatus Spechtbacterales bacterium]